MKSYYKYFLMTLTILALGLLLWNVYLISEVKSTRLELKELQLKLQMKEGDIHVLNYDLTTARDSVRILNNMIESDKEMK
jgi:uncharacterized protein YoxC